MKIVTLKIRYLLLLASVFFLVPLFHGCHSNRELSLLRKEVSTLKKTINDMQRPRFSILFLGDILLVNHSKKLMKTKGICYPFLKIKDELPKYDYVVANLETPISNRGVPFRDRYYVFQLPPSLAECFRSIKLDAVTLANNHLFDFGPDGLRDTIQFLKKNKIAHTGAGRSLKEARKPITIQHGSTTIYILSYCGRPPEKYYATDDLPGTNPLDIKLITEDIESYKKRDNLVFVSLHWGIEQTHLPRKDQIAIAHEIIDAGADAIIGHHPHWPQAIEIYRNKPIFYSLGNFVNGHYNKIEKDNIIAAFYFINNRIDAVEIMSVAGKNREIKFQPFIVKGQEAKKNITLIKTISSYFKTPIEIIGYKGVISFEGNQKN